MEAISLVALVTLMKKIVDTFKFITNGHRNAAITQFIAWGVGVLVIWLSTNADITKGLQVFGTTIGQLNFGSIVLGGMMFGSGASAIYDYQAAKDNSDSAATPPLIPGANSETYVRGRA